MLVKVRDWEHLFSARKYQIFFSTLIIDPTIDGSIGRLDKI